MIAGICLGIAGYSLGASGTDETARFERVGTAAGEKHASIVGAREAYSRAFGLARRRAHRTAYRSAFRETYIEQFADAGLTAPENVQVPAP